MAITLKSLSKLKPGRSILTVPGKLYNIVVLGKKLPVSAFAVGTSPVLIGSSRRKL